MGSHREDAGRGLISRRVAQVVPDLATFSVDDGFAYRVPDDVEVEVGSMVRVPLGGRRIRGFVTSVRPEDRKGLKDIASVSGDLPVFNDRLLQTLRWAALHYVAPMATLLAKPAPPNLPRQSSEREAATAEPTTSGRAEYVLGPGPWAPLVTERMASLIGSGRSGLVVLPTLAEAEAMAAELEDGLGDAVLLAASALGAKRVTTAWVEAAIRRSRVLVGTREICFWPVMGLAQAVILGEGRRGMKERQTPTVHARELLRRRAAVERFGIMLLGQVPTTESMATGVEITRLGPRGWPLVEVADRTEDPPGGGPLASRTRAAVAATVKRGGRAFVFTRSRAFAPAFRCVSCRTLRDCPACGAAAARSDRCPRCETRLDDCRQCHGDRFEPLGAGIGRIIEEVARVVGAESVGEVGSGRPVEVGTERDLPAVGPVHLAVVSDADGLMLAPSYRAEEDALRLMARVALAVGPGRGRRCLVQTSRPDHPVVATLRRGDATRFLDAELTRRVKEGFPPAGELLAVETRDEPPDATDRLRALVGSAADVLGPAATERGRRWLVQGRDLRPVRVGLRRLVQDWRDGGTRVRIDADPIDL